MVSREDVEGLVAALFVVNNGMTRAMKQRPKAGELRLRQAVAMHEGSRPSELAEAMGVDRSLVTRQLRDLEDEGKVTVRPDPRDGRAFVAELTEQGRQEIAELTEFGMRRFESFVEDWDADEVRELTRLLWKFEHSKAAVSEREQEKRPERGRRRRRGELSMNTAKARVLLVALLDMALDIVVPIVVYLALQPLGCRRSCRWRPAAS